MDGLDVLDAVPPSGRLPGAEGLVGVQRLPYSRIPDGVQLNLPAAGMRHGNRLAQLIHLPARVPPRVGAGVRLEQVRGARFDHPIKERLQDPGAQARAVKGFRPKRLEFVEALGVPLAAEPGDHLEGKPKSDREPILRAQAVQEAQLFGAPPRVLDGGDAQGGGAPQRLLDELAHPMLARQRDEIVQHLRGALHERSVRAARPVPADAPVRGIRRLRGDARGLQRQRVRPPRVAVEALEVGRPVRHDRVELLSRRHAAGKGGIDPPATGHPGLLRARGRVLRDRLLYGIERRKSKQVEPIQPDGAMAEVHVGVVEARHHEAAGGVEQRGHGRGPLTRLALVPEREDASTTDGHRSGRRIGQCARATGLEDAPVVDDQLGGDPAELRVGGQLL